MRRPDQEHVVVGQPGDGQPQQRRQAQVHARRQVGVHHPRQLGVPVRLGQSAPVVEPHRHGDAPVHPLQRLVNALPDHRAAQHRCPVLAGRVADGCL